MIGISTGFVGLYPDAVMADIEDRRASLARSMRRGPRRRTARLAQRRREEQQG